MVRRTLSVLCFAAALALAACDQAPSAGPASDPAAAPPSAKPQMTVTHLLVAFKSPTSEQLSNLKGTTRTKADALGLAKSLLGEIQGGRSFEELVEKFTDDRNAEGKPNTNNDKPGSYTWPTAQIQQMVPEFEKAARATPVGKFAPEPVETQFGYHLIRRDK